MYGLPTTTSVRKQLPKKTIYAKFDLKPAQRDSFDADISRIEVIGVISPYTLPSIAVGEEVKAVYLMAVQLKRKEYDAKNILLLTRLIDQCIVFALQYEDQTSFAMFHTRLITSGWMMTEEAALSLSGLDLDKVWENLVIRIGGIEVAEGQTVVEQIKANEEQAKLKQQIATLQKQLNKEKQFNKQLEINAQIKALKKQLSR